MPQEVIKKHAFRLLQLMTQIVMRDTKTFLSMLL